MNDDDFVVDPTREIETGEAETVASEDTTDDEYAPGFLKNYTAAEEALAKVSGNAVEVAKVRALLALAAAENTRNKLLYAEGERRNLKQKGDLGLLKPGELSVWLTDGAGSSGYLEEEELDDLGVEISE